MAKDKIGMSGGGETFRRGMEASGAMPTLPRVHGAGRFAVPGLGMNILIRPPKGKTIEEKEICRQVGWQMNKTILITGCSSGIGKAAAKLFASKSWNVIATLRAPDKETELTNSNNVLLARLDVQDRNSISRAIETGITRFGKIDALINNAGFSLSGVFEGIPREKIQEQFEVNVFGVMEVTRALLPHFRKNKNGLIINVSSRAGLVGLPLLTLYCAA